jgi:hypothetical protein
MRSRIFALTQGYEVLKDTTLCATIRSCRLRSIGTTPSPPAQFSVGSKSGLTVKVRRPCVRSV